MTLLKTVHNYLRELSCIKFILLMTLLSYIPILPLAVVLNFLGYNDLGGGPSGVESLSFIGFIIVVLIAPPIETFVFQLLIIKILRKVKKIGKNNILIITISALVFGIAHSYSWIYILLTSVIGIIFAYSFIVYEDRNESAFWVVTAIHSLRNLITFGFTYFGT